MSGATAVLKRDRMVIAASLLGVAALAWIYLWFDAARMDGMGGMAPMGGAMAASPWAPGGLVLTFLMWSIMMVGMMLPSAAPAILLYAALVRKRRETGGAAPSAWIFTGGYLAVWAAFSLGATVLQAALEDVRLLTPMMASASPWLTGALFVAAGVYQWLPVKDACLRKCRAPLQFFLFRWRPGALGAARMGAEHGAFCVGCCWALMLLLFTAGVMNLIWVAAIAAFVLVEKLLPGGRLAGRVAGAGLVAFGGAAMIGIV